MEIDHRIKLFHKSIQLTIMGANMMRKVQIVVFIISFFLLLSTNVSAVSVKYDVTGTVDFLGNEVWGYAFIEEQPSFSLPPPAGFIQYTVNEFYFASIAGSYSGSGGYLSFWIVPFEPPYVSEGDADVIFGSWFNDMDGACFNGVDPYDIDSYLVLPESITICPYPGFECHDPVTGEWIWGITNNREGETYCQVTLTRSTQPVPEPATMLLLGSGLIGFAGLRKRFGKN